MSDIHQFSLNIWKMQIAFKTGNTTMAATYIIIFSNRIFEMVSALLGLTIFMFISKLLFAVSPSFYQRKGMSPALINILGG